MTAFLEIFVTFACVCGLALFAVGRFRLPAGIAPLAVLCGTMVWYTAFGCADWLAAGGVLWFAAAALAIVWCVRHRKSFAKRQLLMPSVVFFLVMSLLVLVLFAVRQPNFMEWDEFSFWGIAAKVVKQTGRLYTYEPGGMMVTTYVPGLIMLDYAFQFLGASFAAWKVFVAYDILLFAIFAAALAGLERKHWHLAALGAVGMVLLPYLMGVYYRVIYVQPYYMLSYADIPMGLLFGAPLAVYFLQKEKSAGVLATAALALMATGMTKDMGMAMALIAAALICFDLLFLQPKNSVRLGKKLPGTAAKLLWCAALMISAVLPYVVWSMHKSAVLGVSPTDVGGARNMDMVTMVVTGLKELLGIGRTAYFSEIMGKMVYAFFHTKLTMFSYGPESGIGGYLNGAGYLVVLVIWVLLAVAFFCTEKGKRKNIGWFALWSSLGFAAFYIFTGFTYVYVFNEWQASVLDDYNRYIFPYYLGWLLIALGFLATSLKGVRGKVLGAGTLAAFTLFAGARTVTFVQPQLSVVDYPETYFAGRNKGIAEIEQAKTVLTEQDRVFYIAYPDDGKAWFMAYYEFYPDVMLDYSFGGGAAAFDGATLTWRAIPADFTQEEGEYFTTHPMTPELWCEYLETAGCTALYLEKIDEPFKAKYGHLFDDGLENAARLYRVEGTAETMHFVPVPEGGTL